MGVGAPPWGKSWIRHCNICHVGGANPPVGSQYTNLPDFPKNCIYLRKFWSGGRRRPHPLDPPLVLQNVCKIAHPLPPPKSRIHVLIFTNILTNKISGDRHLHSEKHGDVRQDVADACGFFIILLRCNCKRKGDPYPAYRRNMAEYAGGRMAR